MSLSIWLSIYANEACDVDRAQTINDRKSTKLKDNFRQVLHAKQKKVNPIDVKTTS